MSRKYLNDRYCVRCGRTDPTPYLRDNVALIEKNIRTDANIVDLGCGNGRNSQFMKKRGYVVRSFDMVNDYGEKIIMGKNRIPLANKTANVILANYIFMFLNSKERNQVIREIKRIAAPECFIMVELYAAKDSYAKTQEELAKLQEEMYNKLKWNKVKYSKGRFIARKIE